MLLVDGSNLCTSWRGERQRRVDSINVGKYVKELASLLADMTQATGRMFEEEHLPMINMVTSTHPRGGGGSPRFNKIIM